MNQAQFARRLLAGAAGVILGVTTAFALAAPAQAQDEDAQEQPLGPEVEFENTCDGTTVTLISGTDLDLYRWTIEHVGGEGAWLEDIAAGETASVDVPSEASELAVYYEGAEDRWSHTWEEPEGCDEGPPDDGLPEDVQADFVTIVTCDVLVFMFRNNGEEDGLSFSLTPNETATHGHAPDFLPLFDADPDEDGFVEIPEGADLDIVGELSGGEAFGPVELGVGEEHAHGFQAFAGLEVTVEVRVGDQLIELEEPVTSFDKAAEGLDCEPADDGEGGELPTTGTSTGLIAGGAVVLLALGGGLYLIARRRRVTFTA